MKLASFHRTAVVVACLSLLTACESIISTDKVNYKTQGSAKTVPLDVPPDLTQLSRDTRYALPGGSVTATSLMNKPADPVVAKTAATQVNDVRMAREGKQRWLVVDRSADKVWPIIHEFWRENGFEYTIDQQPLGILETEWAENRAKIPQDIIRSTIGKVLDGLYSTGERDKFRTRIERNGNGGVDIYVTHRGMTEEFKDQQKTGTIWVPRPNDPELETEFLSRLMIKLGVSAEQAKAVTVSNAAAAPRTTYKPGDQLISLNESFDVSWRRVGVALDRTGFTVEDRDRSKGLYFVRYLDLAPKEEKGFFSRMFSSEKPASGPVKYRISIKQSNDKSIVAVLNESGAPETGLVAQKILKTLADELK